MFSRLATFAAFSLPLLAAATPAPIVARGGGGGGGCGNTGNIQCCNSVQSSDTLANNPIFGLLGISLTGLTGPIGLGCTTVAGGDCDNNAVCCENNAYGGLISVGCIPITL